MPSLLRLLAAITLAGSASCSAVPVEQSVGGCDQAGARDFDGHGRDDPAFVDRGGRAGVFLLSGGQR